MICRATAARPGRKFPRGWIVWGYALPPQQGLGSGPPSTPARTRPAVVGRAAGGPLASPPWSIGAGYRLQRPGRALYWFHPRTAPAACRSRGAPEPDHDGRAACRGLTLLPSLRLRDGWLPVGARHRNPGALSVRRNGQRECYRLRGVEAMTDEERCHFLTPMGPGLAPTKVPKCCKGRANLTIGPRAVRGRG